MKTPQVPAMPGMTPLGVKPKADDKIACPNCEGTGKAPIQVTNVQPGKPDSVATIRITCMTCNGKGRINRTTKADQAAAFRAFWCQCGNKSGNVTYHADDPRSKVCKKHHYTCDECQKVVQVG